jgi:hypothetical protein
MLKAISVNESSVKQPSRLFLRVKKQLNLIKRVLDDRGRWQFRPLQGALDCSFINGYCHKARYAYDRPVNLPPTSSVSGRRFTAGRPLGYPLNIETKTHCINWEQGSCGNYLANISLG